MLKKILVPVRGDGMANTVVSHAVALAKQHGAHVVIAHCRTPVEDFMPFSRRLPAFARETLIEQLLAGKHRALARVITRIARQPCGRLRSEGDR